MRFENPQIKEAILYDKFGNRIRCNTCEKLCTIFSNETGFCKTRRNISGKLYTLNYGNISSYSTNPIEKKPFFHFFPGSYAFTVGSWGCNFTCPWCQNYEISKKTPELKESNYISPDRFMKLLKRSGSQGTSISFNEPTLLFEYSLDVFKLARKEGYYNTYVTNGYMTSEALKLLIEAGLDAINFDVKGDSQNVRKYCGADVEVIWRNIKYAKKEGMHIELTTLMIPDFNDDVDSLQKMAKKIKNEIGVDTPWHLTQYYPAYKALEFGLYPHRTPIEILEKAWRIGKNVGLNYVYVGNVFGHKLENTYCPNCNELLIQRAGFNIIDYKIKSNNKCLKCKAKIPITGFINEIF